MFICLPFSFLISIQKVLSSIEGRRHERVVEFFLDWKEYVEIEEIVDKKRLMVEGISY